MQVYKTQFSIEKEEERTFEAVQSDIISWIESRLLEWLGRPTKLEPECDLDHEIGIRVNQSNIDKDTWRTTYTVPQRNDSKAIWETEITLTRDQTCVVVNVTVSRTGSDRWIHTPSRPRVIPFLVEKYNCFIGEYVLHHKPLLVKSIEIQRFVEDLKYDGRTIPYVVVTRHKEDGLLLDPDRLANKLAGVANVYIMDDNDSTFTLSRSLPPYWSVYNGAVRIYYPQLGDDMFRHRLFTADYIREIGSSRIENRIFSQVVQEKDAYDTNIKNIEVILSVRQRI